MLEAGGALALSGASKEGVPPGLQHLRGGMARDHASGRPDGREALRAADEGEANGALREDGHC